MFGPSFDRLLSLLIGNLIAHGPQLMLISGRQQPLAHTVPDGQVAGSTPPEPQAVVPDGHWGVPPEPPVPVELHSEPVQLPAPAQNRTQASPESPVGSPGTELEFAL